MTILNDVFRSATRMPGRARRGRGGGLWRTSLREARLVVGLALALIVAVVIAQPGRVSLPDLLREIEVAIAGGGSGRGAGAGADARSGPVEGGPVEGGPVEMGAGRFTICGHAKRIDCVVDGDTFWMAGEKIRIADIDTPETHPPRCAAEARAGEAATQRMQALLNAGPFTLTPIKRDVDRYGRKLRVVERDGESLGEMLVGEGLAREYGGGKRAGWCAAA